MLSDEGDVDMVVQFQVTLASHWLRLLVKHSRAVCWVTDFFVFIFEHTTAFTPPMVGVLNNLELNKITK
jgi:hypothetical protein